MNSKLPPRGSWSFIEEEVHHVLKEHSKLSRTLKEGICTDEAYKRIMAIIGKLENTLERYESADYKGEYNDVDGGFSARIALAEARKLPKEQIEAMKKQHAEEW